MAPNDCRAALRVDSDVGQGLVNKRVRVNSTIVDVLERVSGLGMLIRWCIEPPERDFVRSDQQFSDLPLPINQLD